MLPIKGVLVASMGSSWEKYTSSIEITTMPFSNSFSKPACGGNQKLTNVMKTIIIAGVTTTALNMGDLRWKTKSNAKRRGDNFMENLNQLWAELHKHETSHKH